MRAALAGAAAALAGSGAYFLYTSLVLGWRGVGRRRPGRTRLDRKYAEGVRGWMDQAGLADVSPLQFLAAVLAISVLCALGAYLVFGGVGPVLVAAAFGATAPMSAYRRRRTARLEVASQAWPRLLEEVRLRTGSLGRSIPQALFEAARSAPVEWQPAFAAAEREWLLTTDFGDTVALLKRRMQDATIDVVGETLLLAYETGGTDLDGRLADLVEDRVLDLQNRKDAASRQAGVRFARRFVLLVPLGMALAGLSIGTGRHAYDTAGGQLAVVAALAAVAACWVWSGRLMRLPPVPRVFR